MNWNCWNNRLCRTETGMSAASRRGADGSRYGWAPFPSHISYDDDDESRGGLSWISSPVLSNYRMNDISESCQPLPIPMTIPRPDLSPDTPSHSLHPATRMGAPSYQKSHIPVCSYDGVRFGNLQKREDEETSSISKTFDFDAEDREEKWKRIRLIAILLVLVALFILVLVAVIITITVVFTKPNNKAELPTQYNMILELPGINVTDVNLTKVDYGDLDEALCQEIEDLFSKTTGKLVDVCRVNAFERVNDTVLADVDVTLDKDVLYKEVARDNSSVAALRSYFMSQFSKVTTTQGDENSLEGASLLYFDEILEPTYNYTTNATFDGVFTPGLGNKSSDEYQAFNQSICAGIIEEFGRESIRSCEVLQVSNGSIRFTVFIVFVKTRLQSQTRASEKAPPTVSVMAVFVTRYFRRRIVVIFNTISVNISEPQVTTALTDTRGCPPPMAAGHCTATAPGSSAATGSSESPTVTLVPVSATGHSATDASQRQTTEFSPNTPAPSASTGRSLVVTYEPSTEQMSTSGDSQSVPDDVTTVGGVSPTSVVGDATLSSDATKQITTGDTDQVTGTSGTKRVMTSEGLTAVSDTGSTGVSQPGSSTMEISSRMGTMSDSTEQFTVRSTEVTAVASETTQRANTAMSSLGVASTAGATNELIATNSETTIGETTPSGSNKVPAAVSTAMKQTTAADSSVAASTIAEQSSMAVSDTNSETLSTTQSTEQITTSASTAGNIESTTGPSTPSEHTAISMAERSGTKAQTIEVSSPLAETTTGAEVTTSATDGISLGTTTGSRTNVEITNMVTMGTGRTILQSTPRPSTLVETSTGGSDVVRQSSTEKSAVNTESTPVASSVGGVTGATMTGVPSTNSEDMDNTDSSVAGSTGQFSATVSVNTERGTTQGKTVERETTTRETVQRGTTTEETVEMGTKQGNTVGRGTTTGETVQRGTTTGETVEMGTTQGNTVERETTTGETVQRETTTGETLEREITTGKTVPTETTEGKITEKMNTDASVTENAMTEMSVTDGRSTEIVSMLQSASQRTPTGSLTSERSLSVTSGGLTPAENTELYTTTGKANTGQPATETLSSGDAVTTFASSEISPTENSKISTASPFTQDNTATENIDATIETTKNETAQSGNTEISPVTVTSSDQDTTETSQPSST